MLFSIDLHKSKKLDEWFLIFLKQVFFKLKIVVSFIRRLKSDCQSKLIRLHVICTFHNS